MKTTSEDKNLKKEIRKKLWPWCTNEIMETYYRSVLNTLEVLGKYGDRVLDIGCGEGHFANQFREKFDERYYYGIDAELKTVQRAVQFLDLDRADEYTQSYTDSNGKLFISQGNAYQIHYGDQRFEFVLCIMVFHHIPPALYNETLREIHRVLLPGGMAVIVEHGKPTTWYGCILWIIFSGHLHARHCAYRIMEIARSSTGFKRVYLRETMFGWTHNVVLLK